MLTIDIPTEGNEIIVDYSNLSLHKELAVEMANLHLKIGKMRVCIEFKTWEEMISFCKEHNFDYTDRR